MFISEAQIVFPQFYLETCIFFTTDKYYGIIVVHLKVSFLENTINNKIL